MPAGDPNSTAEGVMLELIGRGCGLIGCFVLAVALLIGGLIAKAVF